MENNLNRGRILSVADGVITVQGLESVRSGERVAFVNRRKNKEFYGIALNLNEYTVSCVAFDNERYLEEGD